MIELLRVTGDRISIQLIQNMINFLNEWKEEQIKALLIKDSRNINNTILTSINRELFIL